MNHVLRWPLGAALILALSTGQQAGAQDKPAKPEAVTFETQDGVKLSGTFYPSNKGKKAPTALLLHNLTKGGNSHEDGWDALAVALQKKDYAVLSFDFRGYGLSNQVIPRQFWTAVTTTAPQVLYNRKYVKGFSLANPPETIDQKDFLPSYYPVLTLDVAAAKAYLDRRNDNGDLNASNFVLIGAGEGATVGAIWLASEWHRFRGVLPMGAGANPPLALYKLEAEPEGRDQTAAIFLSISPTLGGNRIGNIDRYISEVGKVQKVPMLFVFGKQDKNGDADALKYMQDIVGRDYTHGGKRSDAFSYTGAYAVEGTMLAGSKLLNNALPTEGYIAKDYLDSVMEKKGGVEWRQRRFDEGVYFWNFQVGDKFPARLDGDKAPRLMPLQQRMGILLP
jgi:pimeloyl-ACP methyl ester carboxylesterase